MKQTILKYSAMLLMLSSSSLALADYPVGNQDHYFVKSGMEQRLEVLINDTGEGLKVSAWNDWSTNGGQIAIDPRDRTLGTRRLRYTAPANYEGYDEFWYELTDVQGRTNAAKVTITVLPVDAIYPAPQNDHATVQKDTSIRIDVLQNDGVLVNAGSSNNGFIGTFNDWSKEGGTVKRADSDANTPQLEYTPPAGFVGTDEFWYTMKNSSTGLEHAAKVIINVTEGYSAGAYPTTAVDNFLVGSSFRGTYVVRYYPLDNDSGQNLRIVDRSGYSLNGGTYSVSSSGMLSYNPPAAFQDNPVSQQDKIWYVIEDAFGRRNWGQINLTIPANYRG